MEKSTVYFTDFRCPVGTSQLDKLRKLCIAAGIKDIDMDGKFVAIKMHFGELGNMAFLRPNYAKAVADLCKEQGGMPFLTDCNTLYPGSRKNALEHLDCANLNGFNTITTGCQIIIGDGLRGTDEVEVPVVNGEYCKTAFIGHAIMDADIFISLSHFKGHEATGFGGALKNIGMGCGSRAGKMQQHASGKPAINEDVCRGCRRCAKECGSDAITYVNKKAVIDYDKCKGCGRCIGACSFDAVYNPNSSANELLDRKMAEYAQAVCHGRPHFHIALVQDISPNCDCHGENDHRSFRISECLQALIRSLWIRHVQMPASKQHRSRTASSENIWQNLDGIVITIISKIPIQTSNGRQLWIRQKRSDLEPENMN